MIGNKRIKELEARISVLEMDAETVFMKRIPNYLVYIAMSRRSIRSA